MSRDDGRRAIEAQVLPPLPRVLGTHLLIELYECDAAFLDRLEAVQTAMEQAARFAGATVVESVFHRFSPHGISGVVVIAESHLTVHSWPEYRYPALDVFTCGDKEIPRKIKDQLEQAFGAARCSTTWLRRGTELFNDETAPHQENPETS